MYNDDQYIDGDHKWSDKNKNDQAQKSNNKNYVINTQTQTSTNQKTSIEKLDITVSKLEQYIKDLINQLKYFTDAKGSESISKGIVNVKKYRNYYDVSKTIKTAGPIDPNDFDSPVYNTERIFEDLERYADVVEVLNDGTDTLFAIISHGGRTNFSQEVPIFAGESKFYYNVYELRLRSPTAGLSYRVTEYDIETNIRFLKCDTDVVDVCNRAARLLGIVYGSQGQQLQQRTTTFELLTQLTNAGTQIDPRDKNWNLSSVTDSINATTANRSSFTAVVINAPTTGTLLSNISVPNGFALVIRANVSNSGQVFVANSIANATNAAIPGNRITLNAGDVARLFVTNANIVAVAGSIAGQNVDILVEQ